MDIYDSPVVKEIPVFISQNLAKKLVVYRYPLTESLRPDNAVVGECSVKDDLEVMMDLERNTGSINYSKSKGEQMALNADGTKNLEDPAFPRKVMDKQMLVSKFMKNENIAVGFYHNNELHLTPAAGVSVMRPSFRYLDMGDRRSKQEAKEKGEGDASEEEEEMQQVTVKFARLESDRAKKAREKSFSYLSKQSAKQIWRKVDYHDIGSSQSDLESRNLFCDRTGEILSESQHGGKSVIEKVMTDEADTRSRLAHGLPLTKLKTLPTLLERVRTIMVEARVLEMATLHRLLGEPENASEVQDRIKVVQHVAVLVQGCWVVQSDIVIAKESAPNGVPSAIARSARDYMLFLFTRNRTVKRLKVMEVVKLPGDVVKIMLEEFSTLNHSDWDFRLPTDFNFITNHPEVVERQQAKWDLRLDQLLAGLRPPEIGAPPTNRNRRRSGRDSFSSDTEGAEGRKNYPGSKVRRVARVSESKSSETLS